jgi:hypothetical protein
VVGRDCFPFAKSVEFQAALEAKLREERLSLVAMPTGQPEIALSAQRPEIFSNRSEQFATFLRSRVRQPRNSRSELSP